MNSEYRIERHRERTERRKWVGELLAGNAKTDWGQKVIAAQRRQ